jgi:hypothetical protein
MDMTICLRLVGGRMEGEWRFVDLSQPLQIAVQHPLHFSFKAEASYDPDEPLSYHVETMVPTGCVEWKGNSPAEVYVPESRLALWKAEHDLTED